MRTAGGNHGNRRYDSSKTEIRNAIEMRNDKRKKIGKSKRKKSETTTEARSETARETRQTSGYQIDNRQAKPN